jgi:acetate kinase
LDLAERVSQTVLVVNTGSSSLKLRMLGAGDDALASRDEAPDVDLDEALTRFVSESPQAPDRVAHRVVHGGPDFSAPVVVTPQVLATLAEVSGLAPLHNPAALAAIKAAMRCLPELPHIACFDTAFHATLPLEASTYALPQSWRKLGPLRRFGFHGFSHSYAARRGAELLGRRASELRLVTAHLGSGASLCAVQSGRSVDTTMGFTPLDGLVMATRAGSIDPGILLWVERHSELSVDDVEEGLLHEAGLAALSGTSGDMREVVAGMTSGDDRCQLAFGVYCHRLAAGVAAMAASMGGVDAIVLTGGVGENSAEVRDELARRVEFLGAPLLTVPAREDLEIARAARAISR